MGDEPTPRLPNTTDEAVKQFFPGQKISLKPLDGTSVLTFTVYELVTPVTKSVVVFATPDSDSDSDSETVELVVIKINDPRYIDDRLPKITYAGRPSLPWSLANERAATVARLENTKLSDEELDNAIYDYEPDEDSNEEDIATYNVLHEERYYRWMMGLYEDELAAYELLKDLQGSAIPRFIMAGEFQPPDERAIRPPALVLEYIPSVSLEDIPHKFLTPELCDQVIATLLGLSSRGVIHNDIHPNNIYFTPPHRPVRGVVIDFGHALIRPKHFEDEKDWGGRGRSDAWYAGKLLEDKTKENRKPFRNPVTLG